MMEKLAEGLLWYVAFLFSTTLHEASHALVAFKLGDRTAYEGGQLTLDPIPHMKRLAGVFLPLDSIDFTHVIDATQGGAFATLATFINIVFSLNLLLFIFNLLPVPPLDGSGIVPLFLTEERAQRYLEVVHNPSFSFIGIIVAWNVFDYIYSPLHLAFINLLFYPAAHYQ